MKLFGSHGPSRDPDRIREVLQQFVYDLSTTLGHSSHLVLFLEECTYGLDLLS